jgi:hypothetical protein
MGFSTKQRQLETQARLQRKLPTDSTLRQKLEICATDSLGYFYTCRQPACYHCRRRYVRRQFRAALDRFAGCTKSDLALLTVVLGAADKAPEIGEIVRQARSTTRNVFAKHRAYRRRWNGVQLLGWFEVDAICAADAPLLGRERADLLSQMGARLAPLRPTYIPTIHAVVSLNGLDYQQVRDAFQEKWPLAHQVDVRPFYAHQPVEKSLYCSIRYALKRTCSSFLRGVDVEWPDEWLVDFETWHFGWSRSFQSTRISIGKKRVSKDKRTLIVRNEMEDVYYGAMPFTC